MLGEKALELIKEMERSRDGKLPAYNDNCVRLVLEEMNALFQQNQDDVFQVIPGNKADQHEAHYIPSIANQK
ncbi:DNA replication complex GINS protein PSF1 [Portunus trituberculatus]|uniref:DNA replication complex GINS protein PSF1 n=1 Tax=Portunus trituberculatus TaxID=210409 RepID=A0A5B7E355_PORTR|nr:DNA replication complex GINS protein PSF1 [Portunus trituberculatus]